MINSTPPEVKNEATEEPTETSESIIYHTEIPEQPESGFKKFLLLFKRKTPAPAVETEPVEAHAAIEEQPAPAPAPKRRTFRRPRPNGKDPGPDMRLRAFMEPPMTLPEDKENEKPAGRPRREKIHRAYWDVAGVLSLVVNAILIAVIVLMAGQIKNMKTMMDGLLGGLYSNFVEMDKANIATTIPVEAQIPIVFSLPVQQNTNVTLTSAVNIPRTGVVINSGGLSINAPATITLPEGTELPIALNMDIPVQLTIPISLQIPVDIPLNKTTLHTPFTGLQQTIRPLYCTINKNAQYPEGIYICAQQDANNVGNP
jgi:hypothetical protein